MSEGPDVASVESVSANERLTKLFDDHAGRLYRLARRLAPSADEALAVITGQLTEAEAQRIADGVGRR